MNRLEDTPAWAKRMKYHAAPELHEADLERPWRWTLALLVAVDLLYFGALVYVAVQP